MTPSVANLPLLGVMAGFRRFSIPEYHHLAELGILTEDDNLELLEGYLVHKMTRNAPHDGTLHRLLRFLSRMVPDGWEKEKNNHHTGHKPILPFGTANTGFT